MPGITLDQNLHIRIFCVTVLSCPQNCCSHHTCSCFSCTRVFPTNVCSDIRQALHIMFVCLYVCRSLKQFFVLKRGAAGIGFGITYKMIVARNWTHTLQWNIITMQSRSCNSLLCYTFIQLDACIYKWNLTKLEAECHILLSFETTFLSKVFGHVKWFIPQN